MYVYAATLWEYVQESVDLQYECTSFTFYGTGWWVDLLLLRVSILAE